MNKPERTLYVADAVRDAVGTDFRPGGVLVERDPLRVVAVGSPESLAGGGEVVRLEGRLLLPAMVNAHAHLELTSLGRRAYEAEGGFFGWVEMLRGMAEGLHEKPEAAGSAYRRSVEEGLKQSWAAGVGAIGDIASHEVAAELRLEAGVLGVTFLELFGIGAPHHDAALARIARGAPEGVGWQPHAPYSAGQAVYAAAARSGRPVATHFCELLEELALVARGDGACRQFLERIGRWPGDGEWRYCQGWSPAYWMEGAMRRTPWLLAHAHYLDDRDVLLLADTGASVAYCPVAADYFGHPHGGREGHRYRELLERGVNVCLGTDGLLCQPEDEADPLGVWPQMVRLWERDGADAGLLLGMATVNGARALALDPGLFTFEAGLLAGLASVEIGSNGSGDPLESALSGRKRLSMVPV
ncbi:amidohydrolase family protein [Mucisphaera sp.]|uniref:amidohydrolase family protein n=1 Tax=Mucisphaera sp. TaxID=2913024 RepID=UPI003D0A9755